MGLNTWGYRERQAFIHWAFRYLAKLPPIWKMLGEVGYDPIRDEFVFPEEYGLPPLSVAEANNMPDLPQKKYETNAWGELREVSDDD